MLELDDVTGASLGGALEFGGDLFDARAAVYHMAGHPTLDYERSLVGVPRPKGNFQPVAVGCQIRNRMVATANAIQPAIVVDASVVDRMEARQITEQVAGKPGERLRLAESTDGQL